jgi:hypothetical protein
MVRCVLPLFTVVTELMVRATTYLQCGVTPYVWGDVINAVTELMVSGYHLPSVWRDAIRVGRRHQCGDRVHG